MIAGYVVSYYRRAAPGAGQFAFCDMTLGTDARVEDLLNRFTLDEKLGMVRRCGRLEGCDNVAGLLGSASFCESLT